MQLISPSIYPPNHENIHTKTTPQHRELRPPTLSTNLHAFSLNPDPKAWDGFRKHYTESCLPCPSSTQCSLLISRSVYILHDSSEYQQWLDEVGGGGGGGWGQQPYVDC